MDIFFILPVPEVLKETFASPKAQGLYRGRPLWPTFPIIVHFKVTEGSTETEGTGKLKNSLYTSLHFVSHILERG